MFFFFNAPPTTEIYTLSLHDALPISLFLSVGWIAPPRGHAQTPSPSRDSLLYAACIPVYVEEFKQKGSDEQRADRKSTRLNSSHSSISYAVFCLKKKKNNKTQYSTTK